MIRKIKNFFKGVILRNLWEKGQYIGLDILPRHFYSGIPSIRELKKSSNWKRPYSMTGVDGTDLQQQLDFVKNCCDDEYLRNKMRNFRIHEFASDQNGGEGFNPVESEFLLYI